MSMNSLHEALVGSGMVIARATATKYIDVFLDAKILYVCDRVDVKAKRAIQGEKKYFPRGVL